MKKSIFPLARWLVLAATLILPLAYFKPIWTIKLWAPQYPEGLKMQIWINKLSGDINTINGLNHYIGMANIEEEMFPELNFLTYILAIIILLGALTFAFNRAFMLKLFTFILIVFAATALIDMYRWEYKYGHNLNPHAAIKIEGQSYQPPLVGYRQLLNFLALSTPAIGGYALFTGGFLSVVAFLLHWLKNRKKKAAAPAMVLLLASILYSCESESPQLHFNKDNCDYCGMKLMDNRYGSLIQTEKGKIFKFDDLNCMLNFRKENTGVVPARQLVIDFSDPGNLTEATRAYYLKSQDLKSPMGGNAAAFKEKDSADKYQDFLHGEIVNWEKLRSNE